MRFVSWLQQRMLKRSITLAWGLAPEPEGWFLAGLSRDASPFLKLNTAQHLNVAKDDPGLTDLSQGLRQSVIARGAFQGRRRVNMGLAMDHVVSGVMAMPVDLRSSDREAEVQLEAARVLGLEPHQVSFDWQAAMLTDGQAHALHWVACDKDWVDLFHQCVRRSGWQLASVEPVNQAARRAAACLCGGLSSVLTQPVQDWQFDLSMLSDMDAADETWGVAGVLDEALHDAMQTPIGPRLAAVGLALKAWA
jgi:hypothetical protein